jgi:hypothetical protein
MIIEKRGEIGFLDAAKTVLLKNNNTPMSSNEIWNEIVSDGLSSKLSYKETRPADSLYYMLLKSSINSEIKSQYKNKKFEIVGDNPKKFILLNPNSEVQDIPDENLEEIPNVYCVRAGVGNKDSDIFLQGGFVGINYGTKGFDISIKTKEEILKLLSSRDSNKRAVQQYVQQIELFKEIQEGDIILVPDSEGTNIGEVLSDVYLSDGEYPNRLDIEWIGKVGKNSSLNIPKTVFRINNFDTNEMDFIEGDDLDYSEFRTERPKAFDYPDDSSVMDFKHFRGIQAQPESKSEPVKNPFGGAENSSAICVLGESGAGKSTTIENILDAENHVFEFIIPTAATTGLLSQFSPSKGSSGGYILSRLGRMLIDASSNPNKSYTAVFDECHKTSTIDMINDELLQAISKRRNRGNRFISLDDDTADLYKGKLKNDNRGNISIPDNFGFIFISSKPKVISSNDDFFRRVDIVILKKWEEEKINSIKELLDKKIPDEEKSKMENKSKRDQD